MREIAVLTVAVICATLLAGCAGGEEVDKTPPVISGVSVSNITETSATIIWTTNESSTSQVEYGLTGSYGSTTALDETPVTSHTVVLTGLTAGTTYHCRVKSKDASGNERTSLHKTFTTLGLPDTSAPAILNVTVSDITETTATITWTTDEPATSQVEYGQITSYGSTTTLDEDLVTSNSVTLSGLGAGTTYHFRAKSQDASDNETVSNDSTFTTSAPRIGVPVDGDYGQVTVISVSRLDKVKCYSGVVVTPTTPYTIYTPNEGYVILQVGAVFVPPVGEEDVFVNTESVVLFDSEGKAIAAVGHGYPDSNCCMGCIWTSMASEGEPESFLFTVDENINVEELRFQFRDYPQIALIE